MERAGTPQLPWKNYQLALWFQEHKKTGQFTDRCQQHLDVSSQSRGTSGKDSDSKPNPTVIINMEEKIQVSPRTGVGS